VIGYGLGLAVTSRFLWTAPYTNEILDVDTSKKGPYKSVAWNSILSPMEPVCTNI